MSVIYMNGFEGKIEVPPGTDLSDVSTGLPTYATGRTGGLCMTFTQGVRIYTIPLVTQPRVGVWIYIPGLFQIASHILRLYRGATIHMAVQMENDRTLSLRRNTTSVATYATPVTTGAWHLLEFTSTLADSGGVATVWLDGVQIMTFTGDTRNGGSDTQFDGVGFAAPFQGQLYWDDLYVDDAQFHGNCRVATIYPDAAGDSTEFTSTTGSNNWDRVNAVAATSEYNYSQASGDTDIYNMAAMPSGLGAIKAVGVRNMVRGRSTSKQAKAALKSGSTIYYGTASAVSAGLDAVIQAIWNTDPATSAAWTTSGVNAVQAGVETV